MSYGAAYQPLDKAASPATATREDQRSTQSHFKPPPEQVGLNAPRECRDIIFLILFVVCFVGAVLVGCVAFSHGSAERLLHGADFQGRVCGSGAAPPGIDAADWASRKSLWYPVTISLTSQSIDLRRALQLGVCVTSCPRIGTWQPTYLPQNPSIFVYFSSAPVLDRCVPDFGTLNCPGNASTCRLANVPDASEASSILGLQSTNGNGLAVAYQYKWLVPVSMIIAIVICFVWLILLQRILRPAIFLTLGLIFAAAVGVGILFLHLASQTPRTSSAYEWYMAGAVASFIFVFIYICVFIYFYKDIQLACDIVTEAGNILEAAPTMLAVPLVGSIVAMCMVLLFAMAAVFIYTADHTITVNISLPALASTTTGAPSTTTNGSTSTAPAAGPLQVQTTQHEFQNWQAGAQWFNLFMFLWTIGFINAISFMVIAFVAVFWYWSQPGNAKKLEDGCVLTATTMTFRYHLGTLAFGSFLIAVVQIARIALNLFEKRLRAMSEAGGCGTAMACKFFLCCANCCLACFERFVKFLNKNAYIVAATTGQGLFASAKHALDIIVPHARTVGAVSIVGELVMFMGKIMITFAVTAIGFAILRADQTLPTNGVLIMLIVLFLSNYFISAIFINLFGVCIDSVLLSYCYDMDVNNGADRPYFMPDSVKAHVQASQALQERKAAA